MGRVYSVRKILVYLKKRPRGFEHNWNRFSAINKLIFYKKTTILPLYYNTRQWNPTGYRVICLSCPSPLCRVPQGQVLPRQKKSEWCFLSFFPSHTIIIKYCYRRMGKTHCPLPNAVRFSCLFPPLGKNNPTSHETTDYG